MKASRRDKYLQIILIGLGLLQSAIGAPGAPGKDPAGTLPIESLTTDLDERLRVLDGEFARMKEHLGGSADPESRRRISEISLAQHQISTCLRESRQLAKQSLAPMHPLYGAYRDLCIAKLNLRTASTWWKYCRRTGQAPDDAAFHAWDTAIDLQRKVDESEKVFAVERDRNAPGESGLSGAGISRASPDKRSRRFAGRSFSGILDHIDTWTTLSPEKRQEIINR